MYAVQKAMTEHWIPALGYESLYEVSDKGNVRRIAGTYGCKNGRVLAKRVWKSHFYVCLSDGYQRKNIVVARLVIKSFELRRLSSEWHVHHKNFDPLDDSLGNLEVLHESAHRAGHLHPRPRGEQCSFAKLKSDDIRKIRSSYQHGRVGFGYISLARRFGVNSSHVRDIIKRNDWAHI